jgi:hypothetical protein
MAALEFREMTSHPDHLMPIVDQPVAQQYMLRNVVCCAKMWLYAGCARSQG